MQTPKQYSYYAIFDGHAGVDAASYSTAHLHHNLVNSQAFAEGRIEDAFKEAFEITDSLYVKRTKEDGVDQLKASGTTALCALIEDNKTVYIAWVGDSQVCSLSFHSYEGIVHLFESHLRPFSFEMDVTRRSCYRTNLTWTVNELEFKIWVVSWSLSTRGASMASSR